METEKELLKALKRQAELLEQLQKDFRGLLITLATLAADADSGEDDDSERPEAPRGPSLTPPGFCS